MSYPIAECGAKPRKSGYFWGKRPVDSWKYQDWSRVKELDFRCAIGAGRGRGDSLLFVGGRQILRVKRHHRPALGADGARVRHAELAGQRVVAVPEHAPLPGQIIRHLTIPQLVDRRLGGRERERLAAERRVEEHVRLAQAHDIRAPGEDRQVVLNVHVADTHEQAIAGARNGHDEFFRFLAPYGRSRSYLDEDGKPKKGGRYYEVKEKERTCHLNDEGVREAEKLAGLESFYTPGNMEWPHLIDNALKAHHLYKRDKRYSVTRNEEGEMAIIIIDEFTGRLMHGRQWSDGLHQAVEAKHSKDGVKIKEETQTLATVTLQNFFKMYKKLAGMTGTAMTEADEFWKIYKLEVIAIPTNKPLIRVHTAGSVGGSTAIVAASLVQSGKYRRVLTMA